MKRPLCLEHVSRDCGCRLKRPDRWDKAARRIMGLCGVVDEADVPKVAATLRRLDRVAEKRTEKQAYQDGYDAGHAAGYDHGYDDQMKARVMDAMERRKP